MTRFFQTRRLPNGRLPRRSVTLGIEQLETRDCPAAPVLSMSAVPLNSGRFVHVQGTVLDENPASVAVTLSGVVNVAIYPNAAGVFSHVAEASSLGSIHAVAVDQEALSSNPANAMLFSNAPGITLSLTQGAGNSVTLQGLVTDEDAAGRNVTFTGKVTGSAVTNAGGAFTYTGQSSGPGDVFATTSDAWGQGSNAAKATVVNEPPEIINLVAIEGIDNIWTIQGTVIDEDPGGMIITLGGLPSLEGETVVVQENGFFTITIRLLPGEHGTVTVDTIDDGGLEAEQGLIIID